MAKKTLDEVYEKNLRKAVKKGGGVWVGLLEQEEHMTDDHVYFNSPQTGSTLVLAAEGCTAENVARKIEQSNQKFKECK